jgi:hypothetical protein
MKQETRCVVWWGLILVSKGLIMSEYNRDLKSIFWESFTTTSDEVLIWKYWSFASMTHQYHYRPEVPGGFQEINVPRLRENVPGWW